MAALGLLGRDRAALGLLDLNRTDVGRGRTYLRNFIVHRNIFVPIGTIYDPFAPISGGLAGVSVQITALFFVDRNICVPIGTIYDPFAPISDGLAGVSVQITALFFAIGTFLFL
jgi:hypothetical protein